MIALFVSLTDDDANTCLVILASAGIFCQITGQPDNWTVSIFPGDTEKALAEIESYFQENRETTDAEDSWSGISFNLHTGIGAALGLLAGHIYMFHYGGIRLFSEKYGASASAILNGEIFRIVTALMIHANSVHLVGNMASLALFFTVLCSVQGFGVGAFSLLISGAMGNYFNALLYRTSHLSIGASTAVFGAVGILIAHQTLSTFRTSQRRFKAWLPLGGGLCLLGLFSEGTHTDILAHLFGLGSGVAIGCVFEFLFNKPPGAPLQFLFFTLTLVIILLSWLH